MTSGQAAATPSSVMKSRRFTLNVSRASERKDSTTSVRQGLLRCGISIQLMTVVGHSRRYDVGRESAHPHIPDILGAQFIRRDVPRSDIALDKLSEGGSPLSLWRAGR